ncbi:type IV pilus secretin PilQ [Reinekea marinisedimentorum]|uniref:Type IV pilus assembly protein PilQ n=1 Tax=Reinekea marinisedimentorum TaxID=230495 RepID=A0A4R3HY31_9GAMM|nr:type IV pilus secretin PilQ [Reinekea marinisedimentorum]TCS38226.1 type IV pilus assembly protein PilQ [Reinekea marinisedimentorum]
MKIVKVQEKMKRLGTFFALVLAAKAFAVNLTDFEVLSLSGDRTQVVLTFDGAAPEPVGYSIEDPARISLDFVGASSQLDSKYIQIGSGNTRNAAVLDTGDRVRIVFSLSQLVSYASEVNGNVLSVFIGDGVQSLVSDKPKGPAVTQPAPATAAAPAPKAIAKASNEVSDVDFRRTEAGAGQVAIQFANSGANASVYEEAGDIVIRVEDFEVPSELRRRLDVIDFATAVHYISVFNEDNDAYIRLDVDGAYDYLAYQSDNSMTVEVNQLTEEEAEARLKEKFPYTGEKLSLNFQDVEVRDVLQIMANYVGFNLVASDSISGSITLRLNNVPWDQALDLVLNTNGLDKRQSGNVLRIAPSAELAEQDKLALEARDQAEKLAALRTEYVQINYAKAEDIATIINSADRTTATTTELNQLGQTTVETTGNGFLSSRGSIVVDSRTNTLVITDTATNLEGIRKAIAIFDVPVRQVLIEARIVSARTSIDEGLGVQWGGQIYEDVGSGNFHASGSLDQNANTVDDDGETIDFDDMLAVGLPLDSNTGSFAIGFTQGLFDIELEISALESTGQAEVISQPKVITQDGQQASIFSGQNVAILGELVEAGLKLDVTPQITPDDRVVLNLTVNQDSVSTTSSSGLTAIDTNTVTTQVLVENGATLVLGGVYRVETSWTEDKTPFFGDLPVIGNLFKRETSSDEKSELLIFITPTLIEEDMLFN